MKEGKKKKKGGLLCNRSEALLYLFFFHTSFTFYIPIAFNSPYDDT
jgi:hypothetical protein